MRLNIKKNSQIIRGCIYCDHITILTIRKPKELLKTTPEDTYNVDSFVRAASFAGLKGLGIATIVAAATVPLPIPLQVPIAIGGTLTYIGSCN